MGKKVNKRKGIWYINQCDYCENLRYNKNEYEKGGHYYCNYCKLNPEIEVDIKCISYIGNIIKSKIELFDDDEDVNLRDNLNYKLWQKEVWCRDNFKCQICGSNKNIHAHHLESFMKYPDLRYNVDNGITLCEVHHSSKIKGSFHNTYGTRNFCKEDFYEYKNNQLIKIKQVGEQNG